MNTVPNDVNTCIGLILSSISNPYYKDDKMYINSILKIKFKIKSKYTKKEFFFARLKHTIFKIECDSKDGKRVSSKKIKEIQKNMKKNFLIKNLK